MTKKRIGIVGAGISGLTCAYELQKAGHDVIVFEKEPYVGGRMSTRIKEELPFDIGADHLGGAYKEMASYCQDLGLDWSPMINPNYAILKKGILYPAYKVVNKLDQFRLAIYAFFLKNTSDFFNLTSVIKEDTDNAYDYTKKALGKESADYLAQGVVNGYQFHDAKEISKGVFKAYLRTIKFDDWLLHRIGGGMIALSAALAKKLDVRLNTPVDQVIQGEAPSMRINGAVESFDLIVLACPANCAEIILENKTKSQASFLASMDYSTTITLGYKIDVNLAPQQTNVFTPLVESKTIASWTNQAMKGGEFVKNGKTLISAWLHEDYAKDLFNLSDEEILNLVQKELFAVCPFLDSQDQLEPYDLYKWSHAMPKHKPGDIKKVAEFLKQEQGKNNLYFCGDYLNSPWTEGALRCGQRVAKQILDKT